MSEQNTQYLNLSNSMEENILEYMPDDKMIIKFAQFFQNFSDFTRLKIITCLTMGDLCVNDISKVLKINQTTVSHQLKILKSQGIVEFIRNGKIVFYSIKNKNINEIMLSAIDIV